MTILEVSFVSTFLFVLSSTQDDIRKPPTITISPSKSIIYRSDDSITLECKGEGIPSLAYYWKKNGITLKENSSNIVRGADGKITIQPATSVEEGFYQCFARNQYGTAVSTTAHVQRAFLGPNTRNNTDVLNKTIEHGKPFHIQADPRKSFPKTTSSWEIAEAKNTTPIITSKRIQISDNGDLYFAYALPADDTGGGFYRCSTYNPYLDVTAGGSYTQLTVIGNSSSIVPFVPSLAFSSDAQTVALIGGNVTLRCFFNGYPDPTIVWSGPKNSLPIGRYTLTQFNTEFTIRNIAAHDEGDYNCTATNTQGRNTHTLHINVEAMPTFTKVKDGPYDINVTEGESVKFSCNTSAKPEAKIVWFQDGDKLDAYNHPRRFVFSSDNRSLTIRDVCRDCVDRESKTDLMVIQCNASNVHGYAFAQGYLNIFKEGKAEEETQRAWLIIVGAGAVGFILLLIGIFLPSRSSDVYRLTKERKMPNLYETHHSVNVPLARVGDDERSKRNGFSPMYDQIGYDSIAFQVHEEMHRESVTPYSQDVDRSNRYESLVAPSQEVNLYAELRPIEVKHNRSCARKM